MNWKKILWYLEQLSINNERERFHEEDNQALYQACRKEFVDFVEKVHTGIQSFDKTMHNVETKQMIFRINRDVRFSKDKSPYKSNFGASITRDWWKKSPYSWYYIHLQPWNYSFVWSWLYWPSKEVTEAFRLHLEYHGDQFEKILKKKAFIWTCKELMGRSLVRPPRGYKVDTPYLNYIKMKDWYVCRYFKDEEVCSWDFYEKVMETTKIMYPFTDFINTPIEDLYS